ncbi:MAG: hypothetical protein ACXWL2_01340 [Candidatus Chromulinivorax sp.]
MKKFIYISLLLHSTIFFASNLIQNTKKSDNIIQEIKNKIKSIDISRDAHQRQMAYSFQILNYRDDSFEDKNDDERKDHAKIHQEFFSSASTELKNLREERRELEKKLTDNTH